MKPCHVQFCTPVRLGVSIQCFLLHFEHRVTVLCVLKPQVMWHMCNGMQYSNICTSREVVTCALSNYRRASPWRCWSGQWLFSTAPPLAPGHFNPRETILLEFCLLQMVQEILGSKSLRKWTMPVPTMTHTCIMCYCGVADLPAPQ